MGFPAFFCARKYNEWVRGKRGESTKFQQNMGGCIPGAFKGAFIFLQKCFKCFNFFIKGGAGGCRAWQCKDKEFAPLPPTAGICKAGTAGYQGAPEGTGYLFRKWICVYMGRWKGIQPRLHIQAFQESGFEVRVRAGRFNPAWAEAQLLCNPVWERLGTGASPELAGAQWYFSDSKYLQPRQ